MPRLAVGHFYFGSTKAASRKRLACGLGGKERVYRMLIPMDSSSCDYAACFASFRELLAALGRSDDFHFLPGRKGTLCRNPDKPRRFPVNAAACGRSRRSPNRYREAVSRVSAAEKMHPAAFSIMTHSFSIMTHLPYLSVYAESWVVLRVHFPRKQKGREKLHLNT